ncbi:Fc.00g027590.m01.CDS01 [Cosmosporella sp. VM-42]
MADREKKELRDFRDRNTTDEHREAKRECSSSDNTVMKRRAAEHAQSHGNEKTVVDDDEDWEVVTIEEATPDPPRCAHGNTYDWHFDITLHLGPQREQTLFSADWNTNNKCMSPQAGHGMQDAGPNKNQRTIEPRKSEHGG